MTIRELIDKLIGLNPELVVCFIADDEVFFAENIIIADWPKWMFNPQAKHFSYQELVIDKEYGNTLAIVS